MDDFGLWEVFISIFWFTLLLAWFALVIRVLVDVFRDRALSGVAKAMWVLFILVGVAQFSIEGRRGIICRQRCLQKRPTRCGYRGKKFSGQ